jgi:hypothetical protein
VTGDKNIAFSRIINIGVGSDLAGKKQNKGSENNVKNRMPKEILNIEIFFIHRRWLSSRKKLL